MTDPFEVRMRFTSQLLHLNASTTSSQKAAHYALKNREMDEDLHSCILEQLERNSMNSRANIMYFIEHLCTTAQKENHMSFVRMMQRDILRIVDAVAPSDGSGAANVKVVRRVLGGLVGKGILEVEIVKEIEASLDERDTGALPEKMEDEKSPTMQMISGGKDDGKSKAEFVAAPSTTRLDKRQIEQRIEEDRERHKRLRESIWAVGGDGNGDDEFERLWDEASEIGDDDYLAAEEDAFERRVAAEVD